MKCPLKEECEWPDCEEDGDVCIYQEPTDEDIENFLKGLIMLAIIYRMVMP